MQHFGVQKLERERKTAELLKAKGPLEDICGVGPSTTISISNVNGNSNVNGDAKLTKKAPAVKDIIGLSLPHVGPYKKLDNTKQVVALIDDVSFQENPSIYIHVTD